MIASGAAVPGGHLSDTGSSRRIEARIVALAVNPWDGPWMNRQQILSRLGRRYPVLYSHGAWRASDIRRGSWRDASWLGAFERRDSVLVDRPPALLLRMRHRQWLEPRVLQIAAARWRRRMRRAGKGPLVGYVFHPKLWPYVRRLRPDILVYHAYDLFRLQVGWNEQVEAFERELAQRADLVLGSSEMICGELKTRGARNPVLLPNAVDFNAFAIDAKGAEPADLSAIPRPRVGYLGKLSRKVDLPLVASLARKHPHWHFVFVGNADTRDAESADGMTRTRNLRNVHFLGFKKHTQLPEYAIRMDVNVICHRIGSGLWTEGTFPLKLFEYLAAGAPVVSSPIPSVLPYRDVIAIARTEADWEAQLAAILERGHDHTTGEARRAVARVNTWDQRVDQLDALLRPLIHDAE